MPVMSHQDDATRHSTSQERPSSRASSSAVASPSLQPSGKSPTIRPISSSTHSLQSINTSSTATPRKESSLTSSPSVSKRSSFAENLNLRYPGSPRNTRTHSFSGQALQELLMHPNKSKQNISDESKFKGRDWRSIQVADIIDPDETRFVELTSSIEDTTKLLCRSGAPNVVLVRESHVTKTAIGTFDFSDLNAYLLLVLGMSQPDAEAAKIAERARAGETIPLRDVLDHLGAREAPVALTHTANLAQAMVVLGSGNHRVIITKEGTTEAVGVLSQLRLVRFFWENHKNFAATEQLYALTLKELEFGTKEVLAIQGDRPLSEALRLMHNQGVTSLPVLDSQRNVVGNISHVDVRVSLTTKQNAMPNVCLLTSSQLLTDTSAIPLLSSTCIHFIGVILSERGIVDGKDAYPVFHVTPYSTLAHTVAKLCATRSHRMWIVDAPSPSASVPPSPLPHSIPHHSLPPSATATHAPITPVRATHPPAPGTADVTPGPPFTSTHPSVAVPAGSLPGQGMSGRLSGVCSLTDVLNLFARASGLSPSDPEEARRRRRQSSGSGMRPSFDAVRPSAEALREANSPTSSSSASLSSSSSTADKRKSLSLLIDGNGTPSKRG